MDQEKDPLDSLRRLAEEELGEQEPTADAARLIHELRVHQLELEMQNEELRQAQALLEESRTKYSDLYDFAPVGYLTLDQSGGIIRANLTAATLLGVERGRLVGRLFPLLLKPADRKVLRDHLAQVFQSRERRRQELRLAAAGRSLTLLLDSLYVQEAAGRQLCRTTLTDITELKKSQEALKESELRLRHLTAEMLNAQELERQRISRDLHEELGQPLMALKMQLNAVKKKWRQQEAVEDLNGALDIIIGITETVRSISQGLRPSIIEVLGLTAALRRLLQDFEKYHHLRISQDLEDIDGLFAPEAQIAIYRILQESLTNIGRHAQATRVAVRIQKLGEKVSFVIEDDGKGFDLGEILSRDPKEQGLGLTAMEERVHMLGGRLSVSSQKGRGTRISFVIPVDAPLAQKPE
jgi:PAS domain S-box-containing protein